MICKCLLFFGIFLSTQLSAQVSQGSEIPKIIPPSPNAAALEKFGVIPVDYSTGVPSISYPMWSWQRNKISFSIALGYHAGGHKVQDMASNVGLGWSLMGIGRISRTIIGLPDDHVTQGYMFTPSLPQAETYNYDNTYFYTSIFLSDQQSFPVHTTVTQLNSSYSNTIKSISDGYLDGQQDIFSYSFSGFSGKFIFDKNKNIIPLENTNIKIEAVFSSYLNNSPNGIITAFKITDDKGLIYNFDFQEIQDSKTITNPGSIGGPQPQYALSGWLLTKVEDTNSGESAIISYTDNNASNVFSGFETGFSQSQTLNLEEEENIFNLRIYPKLSVSSSVSSYLEISGNEPKPFQIIFSDGTRVDFEYNFNREDYKNTKALTKVKINNYKNRVIKQFVLDYSYFTCPTTAPFPYASGNDYSKRLRLDQIRELSVDGLLIKPTTFTYNDISINPRNSNNVDNWGYNVNPDRNNYSPIPLIKLLPLELEILQNQANLYVGEADRKPDASYIKAGILEKIQYPTGGWTSFEYECNKAFSNTNYYEDKRVSNTLQWYQTEFNQAKKIFFVDRANAPIEFLFKTEELSARPQPSNPATCFLESQDVYLCSFQIFSTDGTYSVTVEDTYIHFLSGVKRTLNLPLNKTYEVKFIYDVNYPCVFKYPFRTTTSGTYYIPVEDKLAGGVRIKKIVSSDGTGNNNTKEYEYNKPDGKSSAIISEIPNFGYYRTTIHKATYNVFGTLSFVRIRQINISSSPTYTLNYYNSSPIIYSRVLEKEIDGSLVEREYDPLVYILGGSYEKYPFSPGQDFPNLSGLLTKQIVKNKFGVIQTEEVITFAKTFNHLNLDVNNRNLKIGLIASGVGYPAKYFVAAESSMYTSRVQEISRELKTFENALVLTKKETKTYDANRYYLKTSKIINSKGEEMGTDFRYSFDLVGNGAVYTTMVERNMLSSILSTTKYKPSTLNGQLSYTSVNYGLLPNNTIQATAKLTSIRENTPEPEISFDKYDEKGNVVQVTGRNGVVKSYLYGCRKHYPVAEVIGVPQGELTNINGVNYAIIDNVSGAFTETQIRAELNKLRLSFPTAIVTTFTHEPLVGVTSSTDANNKTTYYEYDNFNRLLHIRDHNNNIVKKYCYNYAGQPVNCKPTNLPGIYVKISYENTYSWLDQIYGNVIARFFSDEACTQPISVTNLPINYNYYYPCLESSNSSFSPLQVVANGTSITLANNFSIQYGDSGEVYDNGQYYTEYVQCNNIYYIINSDSYNIFR